MRRSQLRSGPNDRDRRQGQGTGLGDSSVVGDKLSSRCTALSRSSCRSRLAAVLALAEPNAAQNSTSICLCYAVIFLSLYHALLCYAMLSIMPHLCYAMPFAAAASGLLCSRVRIFATRSLRIERLQEQACAHVCRPFTLFEHGPQGAQLLGWVSFRAGPRALIYTFLNM